MNEVPMIKYGRQPLLDILLDTAVNLPDVRISQHFLVVGDVQWCDQVSIEFPIPKENE